MNEFLYVVHLETVIPAMFAGFIVGMTLFTWFKLTVHDYYLLALAQLVFGVVGILTRYFEEGEFQRFAGVIFLYYLFLLAGFLGHKLSRKLNNAPYFTQK